MKHSEEPVVKQTEKPGLLVHSLSLGGGGKGKPEERRIGMQPDKM